MYVCERRNGNPVDTHHPDSKANIKHAQASSRHPIQEEAGRFTHCQKFGGYYLKEQKKRHTNRAFPFHHDPSSVGVCDECHLIFWRSVWVEVTNERVAEVFIFPVSIQAQNGERFAIVWMVLLPV